MRYSTPSSCIKSLTQVYSFSTISASKCRQTQTHPPVFVIEPESKLNLTRMSSWPSQDLLPHALTRPATVDDPFNVSAEPLRPHSSVPPCTGPRTRPPPPHPPFVRRSNCIHAPRRSTQHAQIQPGHLTVSIPKTKCSCLLARRAGALLHPGPSHPINPVPLPFPAPVSRSHSHSPMPIHHHRAVDDHLSTYTYSPSHLPIPGKPIFQQNHHPRLSALARRPARDAGYGLQCGREVESKLRRTPVLAPYWLCSGLCLNCAIASRIFLRPQS